MMTTYLKTTGRRNFTYSEEPARHALLVIGLLVLSAALPAQRGESPPKGGLTSEMTDGGPVITELASNIKVNDGSTLHRSFATLNDPDCPATLQGSGVNTRYIGSGYRVYPVGTLVPTEPITAYEVRFVLFDVFGKWMKTLSGTSIKDFGATPITFSDSSIGLGYWSATENEVEEVLTVVGFVANIRRASGKVWSFSPVKVSAKLARLSLTLGAGTLDTQGGMK